MALADTAQVPQEKLVLASGGSILRRNARGVLLALKECSRSKDLIKGREIHSQVVDSGLCGDLYVANSLLNLYAKCGSLEDARELFESMGRRDVVSWNSLIQGFASRGDAQLALEMFACMEEDESCIPNAGTYVGALTGCAAALKQNLAEGMTFPGKLFQSSSRWLEKSKAFHSRAMMDGCCNSFVKTMLVDIYARLGRMVLAREVLDETHVACWNALLRGYVDNGQSLVALELFDGMEDCAPDAVTYAAALKACAALAWELRGDGEVEKVRKWLEKGKEIHSAAMLSGYCDCELSVNSTLVDLYAKCGALVHARSVFDNAVEAEVVVWNAMLQGYVNNGKSDMALELFYRMEECGCVPDFVTYITAVTACTSLAARRDATSETMQCTKRSTLVEKGKAIHSQAILNRCCGLKVENSLVDMYAKCGSVVHANSVIGGMEKTEIVSWNALMQGYVRNGEFQLALELFEGIEEGEGGFVPDGFTYGAALTACAAVAANIVEYAGKCTESRRWGEKCRIIHSRAVMDQCYDKFVQSSLLKLYAQCGSMEHARGVFDGMQQPDLVAWNTLIQGYAENEQAELALELFDLMKEACCPSTRTYIAALIACAALASFEHEQWLEKGKAIHSEAKMNECCDIFVESRLVQMYATCGEMMHAQEVFDSMIEPDVVAWNILIQGYILNEHYKVALELVLKMDANGVGQDSETFAVALLACGELAALELGTMFHEEIRRSGLKQDERLRTCLVDFYGRCGCLDIARQIFDSTVHKSFFSWNFMLNIYSMHGRIKQTFELFNEMRQQGIRPNEISFTSLLFLCGHVGLTQEAKELVETMLSEYGIEPTLVQWNCVIDAFCRAAMVEETIELIELMPHQPDDQSWTSILRVCRESNNIEVAEQAFKALLALDASAHNAYVVMAGVYAAQALEIEI